MGPVIPPKLSRGTSGTIPGLIFIFLLGLASGGGLIWLLIHYVGEVGLK